MSASERQLTLTAVGPLFERLAVTYLAHPKLRFVWVFLFLVLSVGLGSQFVSPGLTYPKSADMQMLVASHPFERFCCSGPVVKSEFVLGSAGSGRRQIEFVWGLIPQDSNGDTWDPRGYPTAYRAHHRNNNRGSVGSHGRLLPFGYKKTGLAPVG